MNNITEMIISCLHANSKEEQHYAFLTCNTQIKELIYSLDKTNYFDYLYNDTKLRSYAKQIKKGNPTKLQSILHFTLKGEYNNINYNIYANTLAPIEDYCKSIIKKDIKYYAKYAGLSYIKIEEINTILIKPKIIIELGHKHIGEIQKI